MKKKSLNLLAIETSSPVLSVVLKKGKAKPQEKRLKGFLQHAENLLPMIDQLLRRARIKTADIDAFLIGRGPGSFTGLRIGFATLKAFRLIQKKPCYGASSMDLIAAAIPVQPGKTLAVALDGRKEKIFSRLYRAEQGRWVSQGPAAAHTYESWVSSLPEGVWIAGDVLQNYRSKLEERGLKFKALPARTWTPTALPLIEGFEKKKVISGIPRFLQKLKTPQEEIPLYFRLSEAEERRSHDASHC